MALLALLLSACSLAPLPEGGAFVRRLIAAQRAREAELSRYAYDVREVKDDLDAAGSVTRSTGAARSRSRSSSRPGPATSRSRTTRCSSVSRGGCGRTSRSRLSRSSRSTTRRRSASASRRACRRPACARSVETLVVGRKLLLSAFGLRRTFAYGHYRRFEVDVDEELRRNDTAPGAPPQLW